MAALQHSARQPEASSAAQVVELRDITLRFGEKRVLDEVSLTVEAQERLVIIGQSGMGKTTILRLILGSDPTYERFGFIWWTGYLTP